jgi:alcohol dehydrogenase YqhD (iron-dependent ADH family)
LTGSVARRIRSRLIVMSEEEFVHGGADRRLLDHGIAADFAAHPVGPELTRLILVDHATTAG